MPVLFCARFSALIALHVLQGQHPDPLAQMPRLFCARLALLRTLCCRGVSTSILWHSCPCCSAPLRSLRHPLRCIVLQRSASLILLMPGFVLRSLQRSLHCIVFAGAALIPGTDAKFVHARSSARCTCVAEESGIPDPLAPMRVCFCARLQRTVACTVLQRVNP
jgi:hypothetical protein